MKIDPRHQQRIIIPNDSRFWQYKVYADIRGGSQDLCTFSLYLLMPAPRYYTGMACRTRFQVHVFD